MAIHHIDMDVIRAARINRAHFLAQYGKISGEDGGSYFYGSLAHGAYVLFCICKSIKTSIAGDAALDKPKYSRWL
jgi:hypothetical protein